MIGGTTATVAATVIAATVIAIAPARSYGVSVAEAQMTDAVTTAMNAVAIAIIAATAVVSDTSRSIGAAAT